MKLSFEEKVLFRAIPLFDLAICWSVLHNPERFGSEPGWDERVTAHLGADRLFQLRQTEINPGIFEQVSSWVEQDISLPGALAGLENQDPALGSQVRKLWDAIAPLIAESGSDLSASIQQEIKRLQEDGPVAFINGFSDRMSISGNEQVLELAWGQGMSVRLESLERLVLVPSIFCPRQLLFYRQGKTQYLFYNPAHRERSREVTEPPESVTLGFSALSDATRLKLLKLVANEDLPAREMADRLDIHESTVSRHLRFLVESGYVSKERREGKFIFYRYNPARIERLVQSLRDYFRRIS